MLAGWPSVLYPAALMLAIALPFEMIRPIVSTPWLSLTDETLALLLLTGAWVLLGRRALPTEAERRGLLPTLVLILVALISARLAAADYAEEALRFVSRWVAAAFTLLVALRLSRDPRRTTGLLWATAIGGGLSALLGIGEALRWPLLEPVLGLFKVAPTRVGGELRVSASFEYATIAAMYFEMVAPLAIVVASLARRRWVQALGLAIALVCTANVVLSLTRAGMLTLAVVYGVLLIGATARQAWRRLLVPTLASAAVLVGGVGLQLLREPVFDLRLVTESDADWYGAAYEAPALLNLQPNRASTVDVDVRNEGRITWTSSGNHPFALGYRWVTDDGNGVLDIPPTEVPLAHGVDPGQTIHLQPIVNVPDLPTGTYRLDWGMLQRDVLQFYERGWADAETQVFILEVAPTTDGVAPEMPSIIPRDDAQAPWVVGRLELWGAALRLLAAHPVFGIGPDNFRHYYGAELGLDAWDERVQANNLYLEILADLGVLGLAAFAWVVGRPVVRAIEVVRQRGSGNPPYLQVGVVLALAAFLVHGLLDAFLAFTPTALLFWLLVGLAQPQKPQVSGR